MLKILATTALAAMLVFKLGGASPAFAITIKHVETPTGDHVYTTKDDNGKVVSIVVYDKNHKFLFQLNNNSDPNPEGGDSGVVDYKALLEEAMKNGGAEYIPENHFLETTLGQTLIKQSQTGSIVPYHNPDPDSFLPGDGGGYGGGTGGGFDPNSGMSIVDQLKKGKKKGGNKGDDDEGTGDAASNMHDPDIVYPADPALVNPVPINLPVGKPSKTKVQNLPAPALTQKGKGPIGNLTKYPDIPNLPSPTAATNQNRRSGFNPAVSMQPGAAGGNFQTMQGGGGGSRRGVSHR